jgi:calcineurin-like phosphoesterase family protein
VRAYHVLPAQRVIISHIPVHPGQLHRWRANIHGHLHSNVVMRDVEFDSDVSPFLESVPDKRYRCVSVEHTEFKPILLDEVLESL